MKQIKIEAEVISSASFQSYGQVITPTPDGKPFDQLDAQLELSKGIPRFYIMRLHNKGRTFNRITRHLSCTQCLGSLEGKDWLLGVAPPKTQPEISLLKVFRIPGTCFIKLHVGTWHAGPFFDHDIVDFYNLELTDTNVVDHDTYNFLINDGIEILIT